MVSLGILVLVTAAIYPQVIVGLRAAGMSRDMTQAKGVAQARLEQLRSQPFYVGREAGDYIDILDTYYRNSTAPSVVPSCAGSTLTSLPPTSWTGYVSGAATHCSWEPSGPLYRTVVNPIQSPGLGAFSMVISTQFLAGSTPPTPVTPLANYDSQVAGSDAPASSQVGVTVAVFFGSGDVIRYTVNYSQIERSSPLDPLIEQSAKATTVHVSSTAQTRQDWKETDPDPDAASTAMTSLMADMGIVDLNGELFTGSRVIANATSAAGATSLPSAVRGAATNLIAPADMTATGSLAGEASLPNGCQWICFGSTRTDGVSASASAGLPNAGTTESPVRAYIPNGTSRAGFWFDNGKWRNRLLLNSNTPMVSLDTSSTGSLPGVRDCVVGGSGATNVAAYLAATGFLKSTPTASTNREVAACATAQSSAIRVFPTSFAPNGVVRITLSRASAYCRVMLSGSNSATIDWLATVQYWNGSGYTTAGLVRPSNTSDPLGGVNLTQVIDSASGLTLGDYVSSWGSSTESDVERDVTATSASASVPAVVRILTGPTRSYTNGFKNNVDDASGISVAVGAMGCEAGDYR